MGAFNATQKAATYIPLLNEVADSVLNGWAIGVRIGDDKTDGTPSFAGTTIAGAIPAVRLTHPSAGEAFYIVPYNSGIAIEYNGTIEVWADDFSIHNNNRGGGGLGDPARLWVGDNKDLGGIRMSGVVNSDETIQYTEIVSERFTAASHGDMRFIVRGSGDAFDFRQGASGADASKVKILASGHVLIGTETDGGANLRVVTTAGAEPTANENTSALALISSATAAINVGPSLRFCGQSGNGVAEYTFAMVSGYKAASGAGDYSGALRFSVIDSGGGVLVPAYITVTGLNSAAIGATSPSTAAFTTLNWAATTATPAGGSTAARMTMGTTSGFGVYFGSGAPSVSAAKGSLYLRSDGSATNDRAYINTDGGTTWTALTTAA